MHDDYGSVGRSTFSRIVRGIVPWVLLVAVVWALNGIWVDFQRLNATKSAPEQGSAAATEASVTASVPTTVTDLAATVRVDIPLRSQPDTATAIVATSREGTALEVLARQGNWFRVKDAAGHVGWVPNDSKYISIKKK